MWYSRLPHSNLQTLSPHPPTYSYLSLSSVFLGGILSSREFSLTTAPSFVRSKFAGSGIMYSSGAGASVVGSFSLISERPFTSLLASCSSLPKSASPSSPTSAIGYCPPSAAPPTLPRSTRSRWPRRTCVSYETLSRRSCSTAGGNDTWRTRRAVGRDSASRAG